MKKRWFALMGLIIFILLGFVLLLFFSGRGFIPNNIVFSETLIKVVDVNGSAVQNFKADMMYYCEMGMGSKIFEVIPNETDEKGEILFPRLDAGVSLIDKRHCRKTLTILEDTQWFVGGGVTYRIDLNETNKEMVVKKKYLD